LVIATLRASAIPVLILIVCHLFSVLAVSVLITLAGFMLFIIYLNGIIGLANQFFKLNHMVREKCKEPRRLKFKKK